MIMLRGNHKVHLTKIKENRKLYLNEQRDANFSFSSLVFHVAAYIVVVI